MLLFNTFKILIITFLAPVLLAGCLGTFSAEGIIPDDASIENKRIIGILLSKDRSDIDDIVVPEFQEMENYNDLITKLLDLFPSSEEANPASFTHKTE